MPIRLIVGLGNPGPKHADTRHNAGFWLVDALAAQHGAAWTGEAKFHGDTARMSAGGCECRLLKPGTYMNRSGRAVQAIAGYYAIEPGEILVVHDEIDLEPGTARLKQDGGHGGHNGLRDIIEQTGRKDFLRLRIGVGHPRLTTCGGRPGNKDDVIGYVLKKPGAEEKTAIMAAIDRALEVMPQVLAGELEKAMTKLHTKDSQKSQAGSDSDRQEDPPEDR